MPNKNKDDKNSFRQNIKLNRSLNSLRRQMTGIYKDTYSTNPTVKNDLERISNNIEDRINNALTRNNSSDVANLSRLYSAAKLRTSMDSKMEDSIEDFFNDPTLVNKLMDSYMQNKWIIELDNEIDVVCKYMPKLTECVNCIKDSILTADNLEKDYLTFTTKDLPSSELPTFNAKMQTAIEKYKLYKRAEIWVNNTIKYGEQFIYRVPYKKALSILLNNRSKYPTGYHESTEVSLLESGNIPKSMMNDPNVTPYLTDIKAIGKDMNIKLEIRNDSLLESAINESSKMRKAIAIAETASVQEAYKFLDEAAKEEGEIIQSMFDMPKNKKRKKEEGAQDGFIDTMQFTKPEDIHTPGCLLKDIKRSDVILLYMDDVCLGYYYIEFINKEDESTLTSSIFTNNSFKTNPSYATGSRVQDMQNQVRSVDNLLKYLSYTIASNLDQKFINNNTDLREEIYAVLKYNEVLNAASLDRIRITYIAPDDMQHMFLEQDPDTHRGLSRLLYALIPAKLWICLTVADTIAMLTRGQDHRVYYVRQNVEQNIAQTLINVINQIKKQNFNIMQIESMNSILGIIGKYNDFVIPVGPSGDYPVQMEVMQGQDINPQSDFLEKLEEQTINATGYPLEYINARNTVDFASQLTMTNTKVMRMTFKYQAKTEKDLGEIATIIYNCEYNSEGKENPIKINCVLPSPITLNINNLNQIMDIINQQADTFSQLEYPDENDENITLKRNIYKQKYIKYKLGTYVKQNELDIIKAQADFDFNMQQKPKDDSADTGGGY